MTAKSRKFPLPLSSLENKSTDRSRTSKAIHGVVNIETPQTATQNVKQHDARRASGYEKHHLSQHVLANTTVSRSRAESNLPTKTAGTTSFTASAFDSPRRNMVERLAKQGVRDSTVLGAMASVPRHQFIDAGLVSQAYIDASLPIGYEQTISQPYIVARMIEIMRNGRRLKDVLEIGTGCGYQAAVLAQLCENVYSIERIKPLQEIAKKNLRSLRIANLRLHYGDGMLGLPQVAPFDGIILAAAGMQIPQALLQQLAIGGRLIAPVGGKQQVLQLIERTGKADWTKTVLEECFFVPLCSGII